MHPSHLAHAAHDEEYEDLLGLWGDLESGLSVLLARPLHVQDFPGKVRQFDQWLQDLVTHDIDAALYLMFQLAATSTVGYSASHALVCGTLCHIMAREFELPVNERNALVRAALTMNIGMTKLQDELAGQREPPSSAQKDAIATHPMRSQDILEQLHITNDLWLDLVGKEVEERDEVGLVLVRTVGLCPPGTFVRLDNGDIAVVLRRSDKANMPVVASLLDRHNNHLNEPQLHQTANGKPRIQSALARTAVTVELNHRTMVRLGLYAAHRSTHLVTQPAALG